MKYILSLAFISSIYFVSCVNKNEVTVTKKNFETEIEQQQNLIFAFSKDLVPDSLINAWNDTIPYIKFTPEVKGRFKWNSPNELMFSPIAGFSASTDYEGILQNPICLHSRGSQLGAEKKFAFHTPYLKLSTANGYWTVSKKIPGTVSLIVILGFNYKVDPAAVRNLLKLSTNNEQASFEPYSTTVDNNISVVIDGIQKEKATQIPLSVVIAKGLKCAESNYETKEPMSISAAIPSPDKLEIKTITGEYVGTETVIHVYTTQAVDGKRLDELISLDPKIKFETEITENGFIIKGAFTAGQNYLVEIKKELEGVLGGMLNNDYKGQASFGQMEPAISFINSSGIYLSTKSSRNIGLNIINIPKVHVKIYRVYENNIIHYMQSGRYNYYGYEGDEEEGGYSENNFNYNTYNIERFGDKIMDQNFETKDLQKKNGVSMLNLSLDDKNQFKGIYIINASSSEDQWINAVKLVSISDIGLIMKQADDEIYVFANSIKSAEPISGVKISLISGNNQNVLTASTNRDGAAVFTNLRQKLSDFKVAMITAHADNDFNYLMLNDARVNSSRFDVGGRRANETGLIAFIYGDRDLYRPGETIHLNTICRNEQWQTQAGLPIKLKLLLPNGREYKSMRGTLNKQGAFETSISLPSSTVTGTYVAEVFTANDIMIKSQNISVEEFMPDRIDVKLNLSKEEMDLTDTMKVSLTALNMFGPPAANRKYEIQYNISRKPFKAKNYSDYFFDVALDKKNSFDGNNLIEGKTDENGNGSDLFTAKEEWSEMGLLGVKVFSTVFDETGRPVNRIKNFNIYTQKIFYGIKLGDRYVDRGSELTIPMVTVNKNGKAVDTKAQVQVVRYDWYSSLEHDQNGNSYRWISKKKEVILLDQTISFTEKGYNFNFIPRESGEYEIRLKDPESDRFTARSFYSYGWGYTSNTAFEVNREGQIDIKPDKEKYQPGDDAKLVFTTPFNGNLLVTIEGDKLFEYRYLKTDKKSAMMTIPVKEGYMPNVYITATLFRPLDDGSIPLTVGHGFIPLNVEKAGTILPVTIVAPEKSRSKTRQTITVKTSPQQNIELTVAVVDEGILAVKNYKTPDPHEYFYQKKALGVDAFDLYPNLLPDLNFSPSSFAGDGYDLEKRVNPLPNKRVQLVALWSGMLHTDAKGTASYSFDIPQFSGDLRVMACAYKDKSFGSADKHIKVADPIVISPSIPRFLSPRDTLVMPVTLTNTTSKTAEATAKLSFTGPLKAVDNNSQTVTIKPNSEARVLFRIVSEERADTGSITVNVNSMNEKFTDRTNITIRPSTSLLKISGNGEITGTQTIELKHNFIPSTADANLVISSNPMVQFSKSLQYLVGYPYGCLEQITSSAFPQIYFFELAKNMKYPMATDLNPATNVQAAVNKLEAMQQYDGGMNYWPGDYTYYPSWWGTMYAAHFLIEAKKNGYSVNQTIIDKALNYGAQKVKGHSSGSYTFSVDYINQSWKEKIIYDEENFYSLYLLALYGKADVSSMNYFKSDLEKVNLASRYMLACTYLAIGDRKSYDLLLPKAFEGEIPSRCFGGSFYSFIRDMALSLNVLLEVDPENPQIPEMVRHLSQQLNKQQWINTQEAAFSFLALGKFMKRLNKTEKVSAVISVNGKTISNFDDKDVRITKNIAGQSVQVSIKGSGKLFYFWQIEGLSAKGEFIEEDKYIQVRKYFFDRFGNPVDIHRLKQGDLIAVKVVLTNLEKSKVDNVVVTDMLPAGFEIENSRITENQEMAWIKDQSTPQYLDVRDDRINIFTAAEAKPQVFYYLVRAVSTGKYRMGPVSADAMYNGEYHSYNGSLMVNVVE